METKLKEAENNTALAQKEASEKASQEIERLQYALAAKANQSRVKCREATAANDEKKTLKKLKTLRKTEHALRIENKKYKQENQKYKQENESTNEEKNEVEETQNSQKSGAFEMQNVILMTIGILLMTRF